VALICLCYGFELDFLVICFFGKRLKSLQSAVIAIWCEFLVALLFAVPSKSEHTRNENDKCVKNLQNKIEKNHHLATTLACV
jgi:choline-glycine betaine transporter